MQYRKPRRRQNRTKTIIFTGGLNDIVTNLELKEGELYQVRNYQEIDSPYHGYASIAGYERFDGKTPPSETDLVVIPDDGNDDNTIFLMEAPTGSVDISEVGNTVANLGVTVIPLFTKFDGGTFEYSNDGHQRITQIIGAAFNSGFSTAFDVGPTSGQGSKGDWTIDIQLRPKVRTQREYILERPGAFRLSIDPQGYLKFEVSSTPAYLYDFSIDQVNRAISTAVYTHVSIVARDKVMRMALDGIPLDDALGDILEAPYDDMYETTADVWVGTDYQVTSSYNGYLDELRFSNVARWYEAFKPPELRYSDPGYEEINYYDKDREDQRATIGEVPGSGPCTGVHVYQGEVYALRDSVDGLSAALWRAKRVYSGDDIDDASSGWELIDNTFNPGGRLDAENWRFSGSFADKQVMCMVDGVSLPRIYDKNTETMYLFDGVESAGIPDRQDPPRYAHICSVFDNRFVMGYHENDIVLSSKTDPRDFTGGYGDQLLIGDDITNFQELPGEALGIFCRNSAKVLTKIQVPTTSAATPDFTFKVENFSREAGAMPWSAERVLDKILYADDRGIVDFKAVDTFGDFTAASVTKKLNRIYLAKRLQITTALVNKETNQYRLFFDDNTSLWLTFLKDKFKGGTFIEYNTPVLIATDGEDPDGNIWKFFCSNDGFIRQMDSGTSFDGDEIRTELFTSYYHYSTPRDWKTFRRMDFEITASRGTQFAVRPVFNYDAANMPDTLWWTPTTSGFGGIWGLDDWGEFTWGGAAIQKGVHYVRGVGTNMSIEMRTQSKYLAQHVIHNVIIDYEVNDKQQ